MDLTDRVTTIFKYFWAPQPNTSMQNKEYKHKPGQTYPSGAKKTVGVLISQLLGGMQPVLNYCFLKDLIAKSHFK